MREYYWDSHREITKHTFRCRYCKERFTILADGMEHSCGCSKSTLVVYTNGLKRYVRGTSNTIKEIK